MVCMSTNVVTNEASIGNCDDDGRDQKEVTQAYA